MKNKVILLFISILVVVIGVIGYRYSRLVSEYSQLEQIRSQEVPEFVNRIEDLINENSALNDKLALIEADSSQFKEYEKTVNELNDEVDSLELKLKEFKEIYNLIGFNEYKNHDEFEGAYYDLELVAEDIDKLDGYFKLWIDDIYFNEQFITQIEDSVAKIRIITTPVTNEEIYEQYQEHKYLIDNYLYANMKIYNLIYGLKNQDYASIESAIIEDDLYPEQNDIQFIIDAYDEVVDLNSIDIELIGISDLGYEYLIKGSLGNDNYSEVVHVNVGDGIVYIYDYRGRYEWTGHYIPLEDF